MLEQFYNNITAINSFVNNIVWGYPMLSLMIFVGLFYTILLKGYQFTHLGDVFKNTINGIINKNDKNHKHSKNSLSQFQSLTTALAATIGTGNIAGVATAIVMGGSGAIFWMWICALFGMMTHFSEIILGIYFRKKANTAYNGGPMYYLEYGIGHKMKLKKLGKILAILFSLFTFIASYGIGNMTQVNSIVDAMSSNFSIPTLPLGIFIAISVAIIIFGGITRIGQVTEKIVPFMSIFYIIIGLVMVIANISKVPEVIVSIFMQAFNTKAIAGGVFGYVIKRAMTYGFKRGAFSNEAGLGSSVIAHTASSEIEPVKQGLWGIFEVFFDTIIVCSFTSLIVLSPTIKANNFYNQLNNMTIEKTTVTLSEELNENGESHLINNEYHLMPIKLNAFNNAHLLENLPEDSYNYLPVNAYGKTYYVEKLNEKDSLEGDYFFSNLLTINLNPVRDNYGNILLDENNNPLVDQLSVNPISGVSLVTYAISSRLSHIAGKLVAIAVTLFAFSTLLGWSYYGSKAIEYLGGNFATIIYKIFYIVFIVVGSTLKLTLAWEISDTLNGLMAVPNLIGLILLSGTTISIVKNYYDRLKGKKIKADISYFKK